MNQAKVVGTAERRQGIERVRPTLLIGLGGTGREVLLRVRQRFVERYGTATFPATAHLWIDTDVDDTQGLTGKPKDFLTSEGRFNDTEILDATINADQFLSYFETSQQNQHIFSWIYPGLRKSGSVLHGARAVRPLGRLAFFHHAAAIRQRITDAIRRISDARRQDEMREQYGIEVETDSVHVVIAFSVAGGTGSGMFLDAAFLLRHLAREGQIPSVNTTGFLVLPTAFGPPTAEADRIYANAYAALKELEYYSARKDQRHDPAMRDEAVAERAREVSAHDFVANWHNNSPVTVVGPPFTSCFLVGNAPAGQSALPPERKGEIFDMIAESVFVDFSRQTFAEQKRSMRSNLEDYLKNDLEYTYFDGEKKVYSEVFSLRFSTFGLAKLHVPIDRIRRACGYRLAVDLLDRWLHLQEAQGDLRGYLEEHETEQLGIRLGNGVDDLRPVLDRMDDAGQTLSQSVRTHWQTKRLAELREYVSREKPGLKAAMADEFARFQRTYFNKPDDENRWGSFIRRIHQVTGPLLSAEIERRFGERMHVWANEERIRLALSIEFLKAIHPILAEMEEKYRKVFQGHRQRADRARRDWDALLSVIDEEETQGTWVHRWSLRALVEAACAAAAEHFEHAGYAELYAVGADVLAHLQRVVGSERVEVDTSGDERTVRTGLVHRLFALREHLADVREDLALRLEAFDRAEEHLVFTNLYRAGMFRRFYEITNPDGTTRPVTVQILRDLETQLREQLVIASACDLHDRFKREGSAAVRRQIQEFTAQPFRRLAPKNADAIQLLHDLGEEGVVRVNEVTQRLARYGNVWLRTNERAGQGGSDLLSNYAVASLLGVDLGQKDSERYKNFTADFTSQARQLPLLKHTAPHAVDTDPDAVFFYTEIAGLPIAAIENLDNYRKAYRRRIGEFLHLDRHTDRFADVSLKDHSEIMLAVRTTRAVILGAVLKVLEVSGKGEDAVLHYVDTRTFPPSRRLVGTRLDALELLSGDAELLAALEGDIEDRMRRLDRPRLEQFFVLLAWHIMDESVSGGREVGPFAIRDVRIGDARAQKIPIERRAITGAQEHVERRLSDLGWVRADGDLQAAQRRTFDHWYPQIDDFGLRVQLGGDHLTVFKDDPTRPIAVPVSNVFERDTV